MFEKRKLKYKDIDLYLGSDLLNQITSVNYLARELPQPFVGLYGACSGFALSMAMAGLLIDAGYVDKIVTMVSSHNATAERQYRYPVEYGVQKRHNNLYSDRSCVHFINQSATVCKS